MKIISLFDGISCAQIALNNLTKNYTYFASEIDVHAVKCTKSNFPNTTHIGDVKEINGTLYNNVFLLIGGSPCQNLSSRGNKTGLEGAKSSLFYEYVRILRECNPRYFFLENVGSMSSKNRDLISKELGCEPIKINSTHFLPQNRRRYYWTNIPYNTELLPTITTIKVQDLLEPLVDDDYYYNQHNNDRSFVITSYNSKPEADLVFARTLKTQSYTGRAAVDNCYHTTYQPVNKTNLRKLTPIEYERLQGIPDNYTNMLSKTQRYKSVGNSFTVPVIQWFLQFIVDIL